jgi:hypothetical protein
MKFLPYACAFLHDGHIPDIAVAADKKPAAASCLPLPGYPFFCKCNTIAI